MNGRESDCLSLQEWNQWLLNYNTEKATTKTRLDALEKTVENVVKKLERIEEISIRLDERQAGFDTKLDLIQDESRLQTGQINDSIRQLSSTFSSIADALVSIRSKQNPNE